MTPLIPVPEPSEYAELPQWTAFFTLVQAAQYFGGWHKDKVRHLCLLYQREYPTSPQDLAQAEMYASQVRAKKQTAKAGR